MKYKIWAQIEKCPDAEDWQDECVNVSEPIELRAFDTYEGAIGYLVASGALVFQCDMAEEEFEG